MNKNAKQLIVFKGNLRKKNYRVDASYNCGGFHFAADYYFDMMEPAISISLFKKMI